LQKEPDCEQAWPIRLSHFCRPAFLFPSGVGAPGLETGEAMDGGVPGLPRDNFEAEISKEEFWNMKKVAGTPSPLPHHV
jgi:hypothetical protein